MAARALLAVVSFIGLAACDLTDPYSRPGNWRPVGANDINRVAMVAVPSDLARGTSDLRGDGQQDDIALIRQREDKVRGLSDSQVSKVGPAAGEGNK